MGELLVHDRLQLRKRFRQDWGQNLRLEFIHLCVQRRRHGVKADFVELSSGEQKPCLRALRFSQQGSNFGDPQLNADRMPDEMLN